MTCRGCELRIPLDDGWHVDTRPEQHVVDIPQLYMRGIYMGYPVTPCTNAQGTKELDSHEAGKQLADADQTKDPG